MALTDTVVVRPGKVHTRTGVRLRALILRSAVGRVQKAAQETRGKVLSSVAALSTLSHVEKTVTHVVSPLITIATVGQLTVQQSITQALSSVAAFTELGRHVVDQAKNQLLSSIYATTLTTCRVRPTIWVGLKGHSLLAVASLGQVIAN